MKVMIAMLLVACRATGPVTHTFIREATIDGYRLVLSRCQILTESDKLKVGPCTTSSQSLPVMIEPGGGDRLISNEISIEVRNALVRCAEQGGIVDAAAVRLSISAKGRIVFVDSSSVEAGFLTCAKAAVENVQFAESSRASTLTLTVRGIPKATP